MGWTAEQETAISCREKSLLLSAAAGAGKTAVLVERIIRRILDPAEPVDVDRLLVVTFTNAAAQEMKERIARELAARSRANRRDKQIQRQTLLLGRAAICTLHSFCLELLRQNYYLLKLPGGLSLDPRFCLCDDNEALLLKAEVLETLLEDKYDAEDAGFLQLVECFGGERDDRALQEIVLKLYAYSRSHPQPENWLEQAIRTFRADMEEPSVQEMFLYLKDSILEPLEDAILKLMEARELAAGPLGPAVYLDNLRTEISMLNEVYNLFDRAETGSPWLALLRTLGEVAFAPLKTCRDKEVDENVKKEIQSLRNETKEMIKKLQKEFCSRTPSEFLADMHEMHPLMEALITLVGEFAQSYLRAKLTRHKLDFDDLEHFALQLLQDEGAGEEQKGLLEKLQERYLEVMVDEYQDINTVQETILQLVSGGPDAGKLFMVGDVKQSIYRFRLAEPGLFLAKYEQFSPYGSDPAAHAGKLILSRNFRSRPQVVEGINTIFRQVMQKKLGGIAYDSAAELVCGAEYPDADGDNTFSQAALEVHLVDYTANQEAEPADGEEPEAAQAEARLIGRLISRLLGKKVWDKENGVYRELKYSDIVILLRSMKRSAPLFLEEFRQSGIPAYAEVGSGYLQAQEVQTILAVLKIIDNPQQDIPLAATLRSAIVGLSAEDLAEIRLTLPRGTFFNAVRLTARRDKGRLGQEMKAFLRRLNAWRTYSRRHSLAELIWLIYRETGYYDYAGALPGGRQRQANLHALHERARQYEEAALKGLFRFLRFLEKIQEKEQDFGTARPLGEKENVVRLMSIHKSKGLEFPVVILAGLGKQFNRQDAREDILIDRDLGLGPLWVDAQKRLKYPTLARIAVRNKLRRELLAEEIRILYVAMTRAKEALFMVGAIRDVAAKAKKWRRLKEVQERELPYSLLARAAGYWDWLGPCLIRENESPGLWQLKIWEPRAFSEPVVRTTQEEAWLERIAQPAAAQEKGTWSEFVAQRLGWQNPYQYLTGIPAKLSVTEIKNRLQRAAQDELSYPAYALRRNFTLKPVSREKEGLSAQEKGSALHLVMRHLDLRSELSEKNILSQMQRMVDDEILSPLQAENVDAKAITGFFTSAWGQRLKNSPEVMREVPFTLLVPASRALLRPDIPEEEKTLVQGTLDCLFAAGDGYILLDYKTDAVEKEELPVLRERYRVQMEFYALAVEKILQKRIIGKIIYAFAVQEAIDLSVD
ncbi:MAG: helicase-exonuclease AddAB subunit AddA [Clostridia bacterium]|jgi:ATP-dependent helicase/nuclease subunit A|nr:helicase-exonuclease AddAB subunit AddA [Clostridia bacterium]